MDHSSVLSFPISLSRESGNPVLNDIGLLYIEIAVGDQCWCRKLKMIVKKIENLQEGFYFILPD